MYKSTKDTKLIIASIWAGVALLYIIPKISYVGDGLDFRLLWLSGKVWLSGSNPYTDNFLSVYKTYFGDGPKSHFWVYPPNWSILTIPLSFLSFKQALLCWNLINFTCLILVSYLTPRALFKCSKDQIFHSLLLFGFAATLQSTAVVIAIGQTSLLLTLAISILIYGIKYKSKIIIVMGLVIAMLKPNIGLVICCCLSMKKYYWTSIFLTIFITLLASLPALIIDGFFKTTQGFLANLALYSSPEIAANIPANQTGLTQIIDYFFDISLSGSLLIVLACTIAALYFNNSDKIGVEAVLYLLSLILFFVPLHSYDFTIISLMLPAILAKKRRCSWCFLVILIIAWRAGNLALLSGMANPLSSIFPESLLLSFCACLSLIYIIATTSWKEQKCNGQVKTDTLF